MGGSSRLGALSMVGCVFSGMKLNATVLPSSSLTSIIQSMLRRNSSNLCVRDGASAQAVSVRRADRGERRLMRSPPTRRRTRRGPP